MGRSSRAIQNELLWLRFKRGDSDAVRELISHWERPLYYYVRRLTEKEEDAWDILQDVWLICVRKIATLADPRALPTWLYRVARNTAVSHFRKSSRFQAFEEEGRGSESSLADEAITFDAAQALDIHRALDRISLPHREVLTLHFLEDFSLAEIAEIVDVPVGTVKSRLYFAKRAMRYELEAEVDNHGA